jgi:hypothetical protein
VYTAAWGFVPGLGLFADSLALIFLAGSVVLTELSNRLSKEALDLASRASEASAKANELKRKLDNHDLPQLSKWKPIGPLVVGHQWSTWRATGNQKTVMKKLPWYYCSCIGSFFNINGIPVSAPQGQQGMLKLPIPIPAPNN